MTLPEGGIQALKWLGLALMTLDHVNKVLFNERLPLIFDAARPVMPLFGFVLAYNLARPTCQDNGALQRTQQRLMLFGLLATPAFLAIVGPWPANILFTLALSTTLLMLWRRGQLIHRITAVALFVFAGAFVEFWWFGLASVLTASRFIRRPTGPNAAAWILAVASLAIVNRNWWSLVVLPLIVIARWWPTHLPRTRWIFYAYYPLHLSILALVHSMH